MFLVLNKSKIYSYLISVGTVAFLLVMGFYMNTHQNTIETVANEFTNNSIDTKIKENKNVMDS